MPIDRSAPTSDLFASFRRFFPYLRPDARRIAFNAVVIVAITALSAALIGMAGRAFDLLHAQRFAALPMHLLATLALAVLLQALRYLN